MIEYVDNNCYDSKVANTNLTAAGYAKIEQSTAANISFTELYAPLINAAPLQGERIVCTMPINAESALLIGALHKLGAEVRVCASSTTNTDDDVAAALAANGVAIFAWNNEAWAEYWWCMMKAFSFANNLLPTLLIDPYGKASRAISIGANGEADPALLQSITDTDEGLELSEMIYMSHLSGMVWGKIATAIEQTINTPETISDCLTKILSYATQKK